LAIVDVIAIVVSVYVAQMMRFGISSEAALANASVVSYTAISLLLAVCWSLMLTLFRTREARMVGSGAEEYRRIAHAAFALFGSIAIVGFLFKIDLARGYLAVALPLGLTLLIGARSACRIWLRRQRAQHRYLSSVLVVGSHRSAIAMAKVFERNVAAGYQVVGVCEPGWSSADTSVVTIDGHTVPVLGDETSVEAAIQATGADVVAVSNAEFLGTEGMRALAWQLEASQTDLVVSPGVVDVAAPRLQMRPLGGLPLLHVEKPQYEGAKKFGKLFVDLLGSAAALVILSPFMAVVAIAVKLTSPGPVLYRSERIGMDGEPFAMLKFRSMTHGAHERQHELGSQNVAGGPLFKIRDDPRVTRLGRSLRRFSIDELPQLFNVLARHMSVVGPRPPLRVEVDTYSETVYRRLLVKPGITGLWQVSGRSDLSWDESVRLDLYYVENWSFLQDMTIIWRTVKAVFRSNGAY
jgi:exopolysaccharide biosynthesis polyprenyl glycosylphosphotransferase